MKGSTECFRGMAGSAYRKSAYGSIGQSNNADVNDARGERDGRLYYMTGNGKIAATFLYGNVYEIFGPPYSSPSLFTSAFEGNVITGVPERRFRAPVWTVSAEDKDSGRGEITDFVHPELPVLIRQMAWSGSGSLKLVLSGNSGMIDYIIPHKDTGAILIKSRCGNYIYNDYPLPFPQFYILHASGNAKLHIAGNSSILIDVKGDADLMLIGGPDYPEACENYDLLKGIDAGTILKSFTTKWSQIFDRIDAHLSIPDELPRRDEFIAAIDDAVIGILVQQGAEGGVLAGHAYHLGYVRDQYGVAEGLISLGLVKEAGNILRFYCDTFNRNGKILNAQGIGVNGLFHFAENDKVEITGYLLLQFFRYASVSGDSSILDENIKFLKWLYNCQVQELSDNELPFNGDETYIACGLLARDAVSDGSAEATLLFIRSGEKLIDYLGSRGEDTSEMRATVESVKRTFSLKFIKEGRYYINDPDIQKELPPYRYGVCMNCGSFGWSGLTPERSYLCTGCLSKGVKRVKIDRRVSLPSSLLMPAYLGADLPEIKESIVKEVKRLAASVSDSGFAYSVPEAELNVGYDYGLLLYNILYYGLPGAEPVFNKLLDLRDGVNMYAERYIASYPEGTRYRPWETAINIDAMLKFAAYYAARKHFN